MVMWPYGYKPLNVSHQPAKFCGQRNYGRENTMILVFHVISQDHVIKGSSNIMGRNLSRLVTILRSFVVIGLAVVEM